MAVDLTVLFTNRIGPGGTLLNVVNEFLGATGTQLATDLPARWQTLFDAFDAEDPDGRGWIEGMLGALGTYRGAAPAFLATMADTLNQTVIGMVTLDNRLPEPTIELAMAELIAQMNDSADTVNANVVGASVTPDAGNEGDGIVVVSLLDGEGKTLEYVFDEDIEVAVTNSDTSGSEELEARGEEQTGDKLSFEWPTGSGATQSYTAVDASGGENLVTNGDFEDFTVSDTPDDWEIIAGAPGTDILETVTAYKGSKGLEFKDDTTEPHIRQLLVGLEAKTPYALNVLVRELAGNFLVGDELIIDLFDGTSVIQDETGNNNSLTITLNALGTTYVSKTDVFRLPESVPATVYIRIRGSGILTGGDSVLIDHLALVEMAQHYDGGPFISFFSGAIDWSEDDLITIAITNDYGGLVQTLFWRVFNMESLGLVLPSDNAGGETILDSIITL